MDRVARFEQPLLLVDNGGYSVKTGLCSANDHFICPNGVFRSKVDKQTFVADQLNTLATDYSGLTYKLPFEKGILTNWDVQKNVWDRIFREEVYKNLDIKSTSIYLTEPTLNLPNVQESYDQIVFEEYEFASYYRSPAALFSSWGPTLCSDKNHKIYPECSIVIDSGFSFTHIIPIMNGQILQNGVRRLDIGGKLMTNYLKELVSFRHWNMMDLTYVINVVKESCCYVSQNFWNDIDIVKKQPIYSKVAQTYVLPDFTVAQMATERRLGYILREDEQRHRQGPQIEEQSLLRLTNERFTVPELLFNPSIIGLDQGGIPEAVLTSISAMDEELQGLFWSNIICVGGNSLFSGYTERLLNELSELCPSNYLLSVRRTVDPINHFIPSVRQLMKNNAASTDLRQRFVTRAEYLEHGSRITRKRFGGDENWVALVDIKTREEWEESSSISGNSSKNNDEKNRGGSNKSKSKSKSSASKGKNDRKKDKKNRLSASERTWNPKKSSKMSGF